MDSRFSIKVTLVLTLCFALCHPAKSQNCENPDNTRFVQGKDHCLAIKTFPVRHPSDTLAVILHGDLSRGGTADYMFPIGRQVAKRRIPAVVMMRPGYSGGGRKSTGQATRDQPRFAIYSAREIDSIATGIRDLKSHHNARRVVLIGYSGGAVISGVMLGKYPDLVNRVVLVACPCDVPRWRQAHGRWPLASAQSPHEWIEKAASGAKIIAITGSKDRNTFPALAEDYVAAAKARGLDAEFVTVRGAGHSLRRRLERAVTAALDLILAP